MSDSQMISEAAVEAAWATFWDVPQRPTCNITWPELRAALEAAAPDIRAQALEDAADQFGEAASWSGSKPSHEQVQRWLRAGAAAERGAHGND